MAEITNLNVSPYYDDFDKDDNFHKVLFRPGFAVQARELTTLQSILQDQIELQGKHIFKEGTVVIPGQVSLSNYYTNVQLATTFGGEEVVPSQFYNATNPVIITGSTSGVKAKVIGYEAATSTTQPILYLQYLQSGNDNTTDVFADAENITADRTITHTTSYSSGVASLTTLATSASQIGSAVKIESGVYFIRGTFVRCAEETLVLSASSITESARVGFTITETLVTPEADATLTDNATGSANYAAKGAHRLKIGLSLSKLDLNSANDANFIDLMRIRNGVQESNARVTEYSVLGETLARRTFDESGDYTVRPFQFDIRESVDNDYKGKTNKGVYGSGTKTNNNNDARESLLAFQISPGKAYVKGFEIEKITNTFLDIGKSRDFNTVNAGVVTFELGNFVNITNAYQIPDIGAVTGETTAYKTIALQDETTVTRGSASGNQIGVARARSIEHSSGLQGDTKAIMKMYLFDVRPFTFLTISGTPSPTLIATHTNGGVQIKGVTSGATGFVFGSLTSGTTIVLTTVIGTFVAGEKLIASDSAETGAIIETAANADITIGTAAGSILSKRFSDVRSFFMVDGDADEDFTADAVLEASGATGRIGFDGTDASGANAGGNQLLVDDPTNKVALEDIRVARLKQPEKNVALFKLPKNTIKTLLTTVNAGVSDTQFTVRRNFVGVTNSSGVVTFSAGTNETFVGFSTIDYQMSVIDAGGGNASAGELISLDASKVGGTGTGALTITDNTLLGSAATVKLYATVLRTSVTSKSKTTNLCKKLEVLSSNSDGAYGTRSTDVDISLGRGDVYKVLAVFDTEVDDATSAVIPQFTTSNSIGTFVRGEKITGASTGAIARILSTVSPIQYILRDGIGSTDFISGEKITGTFSGATATVGTLTAGSKVVTSNFVLDTGQRDNFYDIARIVRKKSAPVPRGRLLIVYDYFSHGTGDAFTVDSYTASAGQMEYDNVPNYTATKVDPDEPQPTGEFELRDCFDFRPKVKDTIGTTATVTSIDIITGNSFDFNSREFSGTGGSTVDTPKPASSIQADFEFYLPRFTNLYLTETGSFKFISGTSSEVPQQPKDLDASLKLATFFLPAYTFSPKDVNITRYKTQRFTMRDIGKLHDRIETVENLTALSLLERSAESFEIQDQNGLNRFKSGFVVDNFTGHKVGDALNKDYRIAVDQLKQELRPMAVFKHISLAENVTTNAERSAAGYTKTGDLITLPYQIVPVIIQDYATRVENLQPYLLSQWVGRITLSPAGDNWYETAVAPDVLVNDGNYDTLLAEKDGLTSGTYWNEYEVIWSGVDTTKVLSENTFVDASGNTIKRTITSENRTDSSRTGTSFNIVAADIETVQNKTIYHSYIPYCRPRTGVGPLPDGSERVDGSIKFTGEGFLPNARLWVFFNEVDMNRYATPLSSAYTSDETIIAGSPLIASGAGKIEGYFEIPDYTAPGQKNVPKFATGKIQFKLTTSDINQRAGVAGQRSDATSAGSTLYEAVGTINTEEITIVSTRNAEVVYDSVSSSTVVYGGGVQTDQIIAYAQVAPTYSGDDGPTSSGVTGVGGFSDDQAASDVGGGTGTGQSGNDGDSDDAGGSDTGDDTDDDGDNDDS